MHDTLRPILIVEDRAADLNLTRRAFTRRLPHPIQEVRDSERRLAYILGLHPARPQSLPVRAEHRAGVSDSEL